MAAGASVLTDGSLLSRLDQNLLRIERPLALISGLAVFSLMLLAVVSVSGRNAANSPLPGYVDWIEQAMPLIAFMGVSFVQREGGHIRMDILIGRLGGRALWIVEFIGVFLMLLLMILLVWGSYAHFERSFSFDAPMWSNDSSLDIALPLWPAKLLAPIAFSVLCARLMLQLVSYGQAIWRGEPPVGVPLIEDAATQAAREAQSVSGAEQS
ncbi:MAG: TRAP transporter small permease [Rhodobacteraceae bacterium]|nr:TRAP transporter small permease [Paracoccaceae bacterium]